MRSPLRGFGLKVGPVSKGRFVARIRALTSGQPLLERVIEPMLRAREVLGKECHTLHRAMLDLVRTNRLCRRLMPVPGVGAVVAITFATAIDDPARLRRSRAVGAHCGLPPKRYPSGATDVTGGISQVGDGTVRVASYEAAKVILPRSSRCSALKRWAMEGAKRRGMKRATVALARTLAVVLQRMWLDGSEFRCGKGAAAAA